MSQDNEQFTRQTDERHVVVGTKLSRASAEQLARIAKHKGCTIYQLIQMVCDTLIRYTDDRHNLTAEMEQAMTIFEHMTGWADSINIVDPTIQKEIVSAVYILQDAEGKKKGLRATMVDKPWMGIWNQTENVMQIFERLFNILMPELYTKLFRARVELECNTVTEVINLLVDAEVIARLNDEYRKDFEVRAYVLACTGKLGEHLFEYPQYYATDGLLPAMERTSPLVPDSVYSLLGAKPDDGETTADFLSRIAHADSVSTIVRDYYFSSLLLEKRLLEFKDEVIGFCGAESVDSLPKHYREALMLYADIEGEQENLPFELHDVEMREALEHLRAEEAKHTDAFVRGNYVRRHFGRTYWWYFLYSN